MCFCLRNCNNINGVNFRTSSDGYYRYANSNGSCNRGCFGYGGGGVLRGPVGPAGPQGPSGLNDSVYAEVATATVATGTIVPLFQTASTIPTASTVTSGSVNVPEGVYLVTYGFGGTPTSATDGISVTLYANGVALPNGNITETGGGAVNGSKTILYRAITPGTLSLYNTTATTETLTYPYISVTKLQ